MKLRADEEMFHELLESLKSSIDPCFRHYDRQDRVWIVSERRRIEGWLKYVRRYHRAVIIEWVDADGNPTGEHSRSERQYRKPDCTSAIDRRTQAYAVLHLLPSAPAEVVKAAYRALSLKFHPDRGGDTSTMQQINGAYEALMKS